MATIVDTGNVQEDILRRHIEKDHPGLTDIGKAPIYADGGAIFSQKTVSAIEIGDFLLRPVGDPRLRLLHVLDRKRHNPHRRRSQFFAINSSINKQASAQSEGAQTRSCLNQ